MADFFIHLAFDLNDADSRQYRELEAMLGTVRLHRRLELAGGEVIQLPRNTFAGFSFGSSAEEVAGIIHRAIRTSSMYDMIAGRYFLAVSPKETTLVRGVGFTVRSSYEEAAQGRGS